MPLSALIGQSRATMLLGGALASGRPHHAYLLAGPPGVGKTLAALLFARALNCESDAAQAAALEGKFVDEPCGKCPSCKHIQDDPKHHSHPLVMWIDTEATMQAQGLYSSEGDRAAAKAIGVRLIRSLVIPRLALTVIGGRKKVCIFRDVEWTEGAENAFLKTLEEPPPDTIFLLLSSAPDGLKPTIRSRCMRVPFVPLPASAIADRVVKERGVDRALAELCAAVSGGNLGLALLADAHMLQERRDLIVLFEGLAWDDYVGWLALAEHAGEKDKALETLDILESWLHDAALASVGLPPSTNIDLAEEAAIAGRRGTPGILRRIELLRMARARIEGNAQPRLTMERFVLEMNGIQPLALTVEA